jgi:peptidoglycan-associated lipoprotein
MKKSLLLALLMIAGAPLGCGDDKPAAKTAADVKPEPSAAPAAHNRLPPQPPNSPNASALRISDEIVQKCGISQPDAYFAFDSASLRAEDDTVLQKIADCFTKGPLAGRTMRLVGHADPRGGVDLNNNLGQSRADAVKGYMISKGMDRAKTTSSSRGEMDAQGVDEPTWALDRRVDMMVGSSDSSGK